MRKRAPDSRVDALVMYRRRCILLERQVARLLAASPCKEQEQEIARLEARVLDLTDRWSEAEDECYRLHKIARLREEVSA